LKKLQAIRGMNDLLPEESPLWRYFEAQVSELFARYGYKEVRFPLLEQTELFKRGIGEATDIVEKEMYTFHDRNDELLTLRPEGTASCVRMCEQHQLLYDRGLLTQKLWYSGPMFRYEKPQKGRLRQFHQFGVESFGFTGPDIDAELLIMTARLWRQLGIEDAAQLQINSLGNSEERQQHRAALVAFLEDNFERLDEDSQRRVKTNPLRVFDSKVESTQFVLESAPELSDFLGEDSRAHFDRLCELLNIAGVAYTHNPRLVRGLDYYNLTVFEWVTDKLGAQGTICGGGRYDGLVQQLGGRPTPAVGFGMGVERLLLLLKEMNAVPGEIFDELDVYVVAVADAYSKAVVLCEQLRDECTSLRVKLHSGGGSFRAQMKKADKSGARVALILGESELAEERVSIKFLREDKAQESINNNELTTYFKQEF
jgi:histidyl-tRNA synthetase